MDIHNDKLEVREITETDIPLIINYWMSSSDHHLIGMGVDISKMPTESQWNSMLQHQLAHSYPKKHAYATIWILNDKPIGHCNVNTIVFGESAFMHLHLWESDQRKRGLGHQFVKRSIPFFFENLKLKKLYCQPFADNPAPNLTLEKLGFEFERRYTTIPGSINFEQEVNLWVFTESTYRRLND